MAAPVTLSVAGDYSKFIENARAAATQAERLINARFNSSAINNGLGSMAKSADLFNQSLAAARSRVLAFGVVAGEIFVVQKAFTSLLKSTIDVEKSLTDINVLLNASSSSLDKFGDSLFNIAKSTGQTFQQAAKAATEFARQGLGVEETLKRTNDALILTRLSGLSVEDSTQALTAAINSFRNSALDSTIVINKLANVDAKFAVSSADLAEAIKRVGSTADDTGVSFDSLIALTTTAQQVTSRGGGVIGNALKTIFQRVQRTETLNQLEDLGVAVRDAAGEALKADQILINLSGRFRDLSKSQQQSVIQLASGVFQANQFRAILSDLSRGQLSTYSDSLKVAASSTDQANKRNEELNKTLASLANEGVQNLTELGAAFGNLAVKGNLGGLLKQFNNAFKIDVGANVLSDKDVAISVGKEFGKGLAVGIGDFIGGPGLLILGVALFKSFASLAKYTKDALVSLVQTKNTEQEINQSIAGQNSLYKNVNNLAIGRLDIEKNILEILRAQSAIVASKASPNAFNLRGLPLQGLTKAQLSSFDPSLPSSVFTKGGITGVNRIIGSTIDRVVSGDISSSSFNTTLKRQLEGKTIRGLYIYDTILQDILTYAKKELAAAQEHFVASAGIATTDRAIHVIEKARLDRVARISALETEVQSGLISSYLPFTKSGKALRQLQGGSTKISIEDETGRSYTKNIFNGNAESANALIAARTAALQDKLLPIAFGASIVAGGVQSAIGNNSLNARRAGAVVGGIGEIGSFAATGGLIGSGVGPEGTLVGAALGATAGLIKNVYTATQDWNNILPDLQKKLESLKEISNRSADGIAGFVKNFELLNAPNLKPDELKRIRENLISSIQVFSPDIQRKIIEQANKNGIGGALGAIKPLQDSLQIQQTFKEFQIFLEENKKNLIAGRTQESARDGFSVNSVISSISPDSKNALKEQLNKLGLGAAFAGIDEKTENKIRNTAGRKINGGTDQELFSALEDVRTIFGVGGNTEAGKKFVESLKDLTTDKLTAILKFIFEEAFSSDEVKRIRSQIKTIDPKAAASEIVNRAKEFRKITSTFIDSSLVGGVFQDIGIARGGIQRNSDLSNFKLRGQAQLDRDKENLLPIAALQKQQEFDIQNVNLETKNKIIDAANPLSDKLSTFGLKEIEEARKKASEVVAKGGGGRELLEGLQQFQQSIVKYQDDILKGTLNPTELEQFIFQNRETLRKEKGTGILKPEVVDQLDSSLSDLLKASQDVYKNQTILADEAIAKINEIKTKTDEQITNIRRIRGEQLIGRFRTGQISGSQFQTETLNQANEKLSATGKLSGGDLAGLFGSRFSFNQRDVFAELKDSVVELGDTMKSSFKDGFKSFVDGSKNAEEALRGLGLALGNKLLDKSIDFSFNSLFGGVSAGLGAAFGHNSGGLIKGYSVGGRVSGGSGIRDDVPAMLSKGEYVIKKSAVNKYGDAFLRSLNNGNILRRGGGGVSVLLGNSYDYNDIQRPTSGSFNVSSDLSTIGQTDENNPQNALKFSREQGLQQYIQEKAAYDKQKADALKAFKTGQSQRLIGAYISATLGIAGAGLGTAFGKSPTTPPPSTGTGTNLYTGASYYNHANGGLIDNVPAMLTGGEFVVTKPAVDKYGVGFLNKVNGGQISKYANGGLVGDSVSTEGNNAIDKMLALLDEMNKSLKKDNTPATNNATSVGASTININNYFSNSGEDKGTTSDTKSNKNGSKDNDNLAKQLNANIKSVVIQTINEQKRNGGLLSSV